MEDKRGCYQDTRREGPQNAERYDSQGSYNYGGYYAPAPAAANSSHTNKGATEDKRGFYQDGRREGLQNAERNDSQYGSYNYGGYYAPAAAGGYAAGPYYAPAYAAWASASGRPPPSMQYQGFTPHAHAFNDMRSTTVHHRPHFDQRREDFFHNEEEEDKEGEAAADERKWRGRTAGPSDSLSIHRTIKDGRLPYGLYSEVASMSTELPRMDIDNVRSKAEILAKVAYEKLLTEKKGVTLWKVVQATLLELNSESLESLGISLHDVPSLRKILLLEGKVNTYIHCHVAVRRITTLHDLSVEISQNEGVKDFDDLKLGPISCHPLVGQYFAFPGGFEVSRICTEDVLNHMSDYMNKHLGKIQVEDFLSFMTEARSLPSPQHLGVRIQSFGMYVSFIRREKKLEKAIASHRESLVAVRETSFKQEVQGSSITKRIDEFLASAVAERAQHVSLSSDDEGSTKFTSNVMVDTQKVALVSQLNNCPYPSAAEERVRICAKLPADVNEELLRTEYALSKQQLGDFVAAWRGFCHKNSVSDVLMQMLFANGMESKKSLKKKKKLAKLFKGYPAIGILNVAILSMKAGHWNSMYDAFEEAVSSDAYETKNVNNVEAVERIEIVSSEPHPSVSNVLNAKDSSTDSIKVLDEILVMLGNICEDISNSTVEASDEEKFSLISKRIIKCERTLIEYLLQRKALNFNFKDSSQFSCKFKDSSEFVELYVDRISRILSELWAKKVESNLDIILAEGIVRTFIYQVSTAIENIDGLPENIIAQLLAKQFHLLNASEWCLHVVKKHIKALKSKRASSSLLFYSCALLVARTGNMSTYAVAVDFEKNQGIEMKNVPRVGSLGSVTSMDARNCLLKAPMLCNLLEWSQWNTVFSPTLGPLLDWLEREGTAGELVCLVTCEGSILRIDGSATVDSFLAVAAKGLGKEASLQLISLLATYGGVDKVPLALLRSYSSKAMEILVGRSKVADKKRRKPLPANETGQLTKRAKHSLLDNAGSLSRSSQWSIDDISEDTYPGKFSGPLEFVLELFLFVPSEFSIFVGSIVIPALCGIVPDAPTALLHSCFALEHRMRLHEVGMALGITEWAKDFHSLFAESHSERLSQVLPSNKSENVSAESSLRNMALGDISIKAPTEENSTECGVSMPSTVGKALEQQSSSALKSNTSEAEPNYCKWNQIKHEDEASEVITSIRKEEFGMDLELTSKELKLLAKQHARIGRALQCLSRELYSQDSHYVLELVQNADDNRYEHNVDAMLVFILQHERVVVVNNELGFTPENMRALCDVGRSTKIGSAAGYIGQKGIGFKSVFRITDSPQIHSRGFHVKFDISQGNIGFVLPTVIPPVEDWNSIEDVLSTTENLTKHGKQIWNTCMVLPLKDSVANGPDVELLSSKLGDIRPSLLLFLRQLCSITVKDDLKGSMRIMQRYDLGDGLIRVCDNEHSSYWLVVKQQLDAVVDHPKVETTEIALAFPLQEVSTGEFQACNEHQQVFSFLPLRSYGLKFIVQGDFVLPSSREDLDTDNPWNQWLLSEIPNVCVKALETFKGVSFFKKDSGKVASVFMSFLPFEGEVQGFFSSLPRMIYASLRASPCLPIEGREGEWALPCVLLGGWNDSVRCLLPEQLLWELLGLRYLHKDVVLSPVLTAELGIRLYGSQVLIDFMEGLCAKKDVLARLGPRWIGFWLVALQRCFTSESQKHSHFLRSTVAVQDLKRLRSLPFIPLSNGTFTSLEGGPVWLPSADANSATERTGILGYFPLLYSELRTVSALLLMPECKENNPESAENDMLTTGPEERSHLLLMLRQLGVGQILEHEVVTTHILPSMTSEDIWNKSKLLLMQFLAFVMVHLESNCKHCKADGPSIIKILQSDAIVVTNKGYRRVTQEPLHFGVEFGCPVNAKEIFNGLQMSWTEIDPAYLQAFQGWQGNVACSKWRSFFMELGITDFVKLKLVEKQLHNKATSIWRDIPWEGYDDHGDVVTVRDWECSEIVQLLEYLCDLSSDLPERLVQCSQILSAFDLLWEESYSECKATYWINSLSESISRQNTLPSFVLHLRSFAWVQSSFDGKLYHPRELFYRCSAIEAVLGNNAPYATPQIKSTKLAIDLGLQTAVSASALLHVLKLWNQLSIHISVGQMTRLYTCLWNEMNGDKGVQQFLQTEAWIFVPETIVVKTSMPALGRFLYLKDVFWRDETGCLSLILSADDVSRGRLSLRALNTLYPALHPFFVDECHVRDTLSLKEYYGMLKILADTHSPRKVLHQVLAVFAMWSDNIKTGLVSSTDLSEWKELLQKPESRVVPTVQEKWVSLHSSEGTVCWCDDEALGKLFLGSKGIYYVPVSTAASIVCQGRVAESINAEKLAFFLEAMGIPPLSKVVEREPIAYGAQRSKYFIELLNWAIPYVQRYLQKLHPDLYMTLQNTGIHSRLSNFTCVVCDQLFFRYKLPGDFSIASERMECNHLLEGNVLYATQLDNLNNLFLEFSKLFFDRMSNLQLANFLHLITLSVQSGANEAEVEAILDSQGINPSLEGETKWNFPFSENDQSVLAAKEFTEPYVADSSRRRGKGYLANTWPPRSLQQTFGSVKHKSLNADRLASCQRSLDTVMKEIEAKRKQQSGGGVGDKILQSESGTVSEVATAHQDLNSAQLSNQLTFSNRDQLVIGQANEHHQAVTGRLGEAIVFNHLLEKHGPEHVRWLNADSESGFPYDIVVKGSDGQQKLVEVKTTWTEDKDWFEISQHEWELACKMGDRFLIVRVFLGGGSSARFVWLPDPSKLCQQRLLKLALILPQQHHGLGLLEHL